MVHPFAKQLKPIFDDVVKDIPDIKVVEIDVEEHSRHCKQL